MKVAIAVVDKLEVLLDHEECADIASMYLFAKGKDMLSIPLCKRLFDFCKIGVSITTCAYTTKEDFMFHLGRILNHEDTYLMSESAYTLPEYIAKDYNLTILGSGKPKTRTSRSRKPKVAKKVEEPLLEKPVPFDTPGKDKVTYDNTATITKEELIIDSNELTMNNDGFAIDNQVVTAAEDEIGLKEPAKSTWTNHDGFRHTDDGIADFLKRSGVRASDLVNYDKTDTELGDTIMTVLELNTDKNRINSELRSMFHSDCEIIMSWIGVNVNKLHQISVASVIK